MINHIFILPLIQYKIEYYRDKDLHKVLYNMILNQ